MALNSITLMKLVMGEGCPPDLLEHIQEMRDTEFRKNTSLDREGDKLTVPKSMTLQDAVRFLESKITEEETEVSIFETIDAFPFDAAHALTLVIKEMFGFSGSEPSTIETPFGPINYAPKFVPVEISHEAKVQVPWGTFCIPGIEGSLETGFATKDDRVIFVLKGSVKGKHKSIVMELAQSIRIKLKEASIYRGKAIKVAFRDKDGKKIFFTPNITPEFMNLDCPNQPIFNKSTEDQIALSIYNPIEHTDRMRKHGVKIKRTVLLEGDFGTGKTLTAHQTARLCGMNGWTFLYVVDCRDLDLAMKLADQYAPAVVFAEDTDRVMGGDRDEEMDRLSYVLDGVDTKTKELIVILTTNNIKDIQRLMLRPGRTDAVISIQPPDEDTV